jgi:phytoene synthase
MALKNSQVHEATFTNNLSKRVIASKDDYAYCRQVMRQASKNYSFASNFLPMAKRHHVDALYAFFRIGDDRVDVSHHGYDTPMAGIESWEASYWLAIDKGDSPDPAMRAYLNTAIECGIPDDTMKPFFRAMKEDLVKTRFDTFEELLHYMDGSALPVGRAMTYILGVREPYTFSDALPKADALSIAMQLSNFWRDIGQDWQIGRIYIPQEDLQLFKVSEADLAAGHLSGRFTELMEFEMRRTEEYYVTAKEGVPMLASGQWGVMSSLLIYQAIMSSIRQNKYDVFSRRGRTNTFQKVILLLNAGMQLRNP